MSDRPNIVFLLADDLGWRDLACYGSTFYETPNLDRLAREGMTFTDAYAACPVCSPTRASLLTGQYPAQVGVTNYIDFKGNTHPSRGKLIDAPYLHHIPTTHTTYAKALRDRGGYQTWHVGKWHCGGESSLPQDHGFEVNIGGCEWGAPGQQGYFSPWGMPDPELQKANEQLEPGRYLDDYLTDRAVDLIENRDTDRPFLLNMWYYLVHTPIQAPEHLIKKYEEKAKRLKLDQIDPMVEGDFHPTERKKDIRTQYRIIQSNPVYAAMVELMDQCIGRVMDAVERAGEEDNTLFIFTSDNGGLSTSESSPTCNLPLQMGKGWMYDGGTREPWIVKYPGVVEPGTSCHSPLTSPDLFPTLLDIAGLDLMPEQHSDGVSLTPLLHGDQDFDRGPVYWHFPHYGNQGGTPTAAVREGKWKLIEWYEDDHLELYNMHDDIGETRDLTDQHPDVVADLHAKLKAWRDRMGARYPEPNPDYQPSNAPEADPCV